MNKIVQCKFVCLIQVWQIETSQFILQHRYDIISVRGQLEPVLKIVVLIKAIENNR